MIFLSDFPLTNLTLGTYQIYQQLPIGIIAISFYPNYYGILLNLCFFQIYDPVNLRYEPPFPKLPPMTPVAGKNTKYSVEMGHYGFRIMRKSNNNTM